MRFTRPEPKAFSGDRDRLIYFRPSADTKVGITRSSEPPEEDYISYGVEIRHDDLHWCIYRRYSEFSFIHDTVAVPRRIKIQFPKKVWFGNRTESVIKDRQNALNEYMHQLLQHESALRHPHLQSFLAPNYLILFFPAAYPINGLTSFNLPRPNFPAQADRRILSQGQSPRRRSLGDLTRLPGPRTPREGLPRPATPTATIGSFSAHESCPDQTDSVQMSREDLDRFKENIVVDVTSAICDMMTERSIKIRAGSGASPSSRKSTIDQRQLIQNEVEIWKRRAMELQRENEKLWHATRQSPLAANDRGQLDYIAAAATPSYGRESDGPASLQTPRQSTEEQPAPSFHESSTARSRYPDGDVHRLTLTQDRLEKLGHRSPRTSFGYSILSKHKRTMSQHSQISMLSHARPHLRHGHERTFSTISGVSNLTTRSTPAAFHRTRLLAPRHRKFQSFQTLLGGAPPEDIRERPLSERYAIPSPRSPEARTATPPISPSPPPPSASHGGRRSSTQRLDPDGARRESSDSAPSTMSSSGAPAPPSEDTHQEFPSSTDRTSTDRTGSSAVERKISLLSRATVRQNSGSARESIASQRAETSDWSLRSLFPRSGSPADIQVVNTRAVAPPEPSSPRATSPSVIPNESGHNST